MSPVKFMPSMMCVDPFAADNIIHLFDTRSSVGALHIDVMDGHFVPNLQLGTDYCRQLRRHTSKPLDFHLMVEHPEDKVRWFDMHPGDIVSIHLESTNHFLRAADHVSACGGEVFAALNPATPLCMTEDILPYCSGVLIMTVNPGYAGQKLIESTIDKISRTRNMLDRLGCTETHIEVDGNVSFANYLRMRDAGADMFVIGSSGFLCSDDLSVIERELDKFENA